MYCIKMNLHHAWHGVDPEDFPQDPTHPGIYFMQNTMVRGGGWPVGEKMICYDIGGDSKIVKYYVVKTGREL